MACGCRSETGVAQQLPCTDDRCGADMQRRQDGDGERAAEASTKVIYHSFLTNFSFHLNQYVSCFAGSAFIICFSSCTFLFSPLTGFMILLTGSDSAGGTRIELLLVTYHASRLTKCLRKLCIRMQVSRGFPSF